MNPKRYVITGNTREGFTVIDTYIPGMKTLQTFGRKRHAEEYIETHRRMKATALSPEAKAISSMPNLFQISVDDGHPGGGWWLQARTLRQKNPPLAPFWPLLDFKDAWKSVLVPADAAAEFWDWCAALPDWARDGYPDHPFPLKFVPHVGRDAYVQR